MIGGECTTVPEGVCCISLSSEMEFTALDHVLGVCVFLGFRSALLPGFTSASVSSTYFRMQRLFQHACFVYHMDDFKVFSEADVQ